MSLPENPLDTPATRRLADRALDLVERWLVIKEEEIIHRKNQLTLAVDKMENQETYHEQKQREMDQQDRHLKIQEEKLRLQKEKQEQARGNWPGIDLDG